MSCDTRCDAHSIVSAQDLSPNSKPICCEATDNLLWDARRSSCRCCWLWTGAMQLRRQRVFASCRRPWILRVRVSVISTVSAHAIAPTDNQPLNSNAASLRGIASACLPTTVSSRRPPYSRWPWIVSRHCRQARSVSSRPTSSLLRCIRTLTLVLVSLLLTRWWNTWTSDTLSSPPPSRTLSALPLTAELPPSTMGKRTPCSHVDVSPSR
mmetsp:Transcript_25112/g.54426  ORF Transcript_25112/g.54426 Transcript_25112/m.54426 type:complete len:210 (-) Transcript_25112:1190-1819(-)